MRTPRRAPLSPSLLALALALGGCNADGETPTPSATPTEAATPTPEPTPTPTATLPAPSWSIDLGEAENMTALYVILEGPEGAEPTTRDSLVISNMAGLEADIETLCIAYNQLGALIVDLWFNGAGEAHCAALKDAADALEAALAPYLSEDSYLALYYPTLEEAPEADAFVPGTFWFAQDSKTPPAGVVGTLNGGVIFLQGNPGQAIADSFDQASCVSGGAPWDEDALYASYYERGFEVGSLTVSALDSEELTGTLSDSLVRVGSGENLASGQFTGALVDAPRIEVVVPYPIPEGERSTSGVTISAARATP